MPTREDPRGPGHAPPTYAASDSLRRVSLGSMGHRSRLGGSKRSSSGVYALEEPTKIRIGVCAMDKKAQAKPMREILSRITSFNEFEVITFGDKTILEEPYEQWPQCDCLLSWHSDGFPLKKAQAYVHLRRPFCVNDLQQLDLLMDRRKVYKTLQENSIPVPNHIVVSRDDLPEGVKDPPGFVEDHDYVEMNGQRIYKPFVEKPVSGEDHNVYIYYPYSMGGGVKRLFRKVDDKSSQYDPNHPGTVRRGDSYMYEEFLATGGTDVKVYTVGPRYAHAEARKSPVVDGKVNRSADGKELRFPVLLSPQEKEIARMVSLAFGQKVCGFDLLRSERGRSFVCDVNGWSFVKNSKKYYDDAAGILRSIILTALAPHRLNTMPMLLPSPIYPSVDETAPLDNDMHNVMSFDRLEGLDDPFAEEEGMDGNPAEELRCVLAVIRHGDRTPKQKMKMKVSQQPLLDLFERYKDKKGQQAKLKTPNELQDLLDVTRELQQRLAAEGAKEKEQAAAAGKEGGAVEGKAKDDLKELKERLQIVRTVLEAGGHFSGVNRKVQLKPIRWSNAAAAAGLDDSQPPSARSERRESLGGAPGGLLSVPSASTTAAAAAAVAACGALLNGGSSSSGGGVEGAAAAAAAQPSQQPAAPSPPGPGPNGKVEELLLVLKWGGVLTHAGRKQAEDLGTHFRAAMYPRYGPAGGGLLRLHSTYRHDLKIYSSDEGRVQTSAAAFTKGLLDLEGNSLTPILVSLVNKDASMLEAFGKGASDDMHKAKEVLYQQLTWDGFRSKGQPPVVHLTTALSTAPPSPHHRALAAPPPLLLPPGVEGDAARPRSPSAVAAAAAAAALPPVPGAVGREPSERVHLMQKLRVMAEAGPRPGPDEDGGASSASSATATAAAAAEPSPAAPVPEPAPGPSVHLMPSDPVAILHAMVGQLTELVEALRASLVTEGERARVAAATGKAAAAAAGGSNGGKGGAEGGGNGGNGDGAPRPLGSAYSSLKHGPEEWELEPEKPCGQEQVLLMYDRWRKLLKSFYNEKKDQFDISKVPDIYDSVKYDVIHNMHLGLTGLPALYENAKKLADVVIPNEYGLQPEDRLSIGTKICRELVGKLLSDMSNMREESMQTSWGEDEGGANGSEPTTAAFGDSMFTEFGNTDENMVSRKGKLAVRSASPLSHASSAPPGGALSPAGTVGTGQLAGAGPSGRSAGPSGGGAGEEEPLGDGDQEADVMHRLCPTYASDINSPLRHVRTRIYFTSESHIHSLVNVLRFCHLRPGCDGTQSLINDEGQDLLQHTPEFDYLTHIVIRMYENKQVPVSAPERFRVEIAFSPGASDNPVNVRPEANDHALDVKPRVVLNMGAGTAETLAEVEALLGPLAKARKPQQVPPYALQVALKAPSNPMSETSSSRASAANLLAGAASGSGPTFVSQRSQNLSSNPQA